MATTSCLGRKTTGQITILDTADVTGKRASEFAAHSRAFEQNLPFLFLLPSATLSNHGDDSRRRLHLLTMTLDCAVFWILWGQEPLARIRHGHTASPQQAERTERRIAIIIFLLFLLLNHCQDHQP